MDFFMIKIFIVVYENEDVSMNRRIMSKMSWSYGILSMKLEKIVSSLLSLVDVVVVIMIVTFDIWYRRILSLKFLFRYCVCSQQIA